MYFDRNMNGNKGRNFFEATLKVQCSVTHISMHPSKELCSEMALGEVGVSLS